MLNRLRLVARQHKTWSRTPLPARNFTATRHRPNQYVRFDDRKPVSPGNFRQWDSAIKVGVIGFGLCTAYYVAHLEQVPETGRWRFMDVSPALEMKLAQASRAQVHSEFQGKILPPHHPLTLHVQRIVQRILSASNLGSVKTDQPASIRASRTHSNESFWDTTTGELDHSSVTPGLEQGPIGVVEREWDVVVVNDSKVVNAAASPGIVFVFTGMLPVTEDEHGLAAVLSHEIGHVVMRHVPERISSQKVFFVIASLLDILGLDLGFSRLLTTVLLDLPNSRLQEKEADVIGIRLMSKACYDPSAAPRVFQRLSELEKKVRMVSMEFLQTHPLSEKRVKYLEELLPEAFGILAANPECSLMQEQLLAFRSSPAFSHRFGAMQ